MRVIPILSLISIVVATWACGCATSCGALGDLRDAPLEPGGAPASAGGLDAQAASPSLPRPEALTGTAAAAAEEPPVLACGVRLVISELMIDPRATADNRGEYVELYNPGPVGVDLRGFRIDDGRHSPDTIGGELARTIPPGGFAIIAPSDDRDANGGLEPVAVVRSFSLSNAAGLVRLHDPCGGVAARVRYDTRAPWPRGRAGVAVELVAKDADPQLPQSWRRATARMSSGDRGTPGWASWAGGRKARGAGFTPPSTWWPLRTLPGTASYPVGPSAGGSASPSASRATPAVPRAAGAEAPPAPALFSAASGEPPASVVGPWSGRRPPRPVGVELQGGGVSPR